MKHISLPFYSKFNCMAGECPLNCCQFYRIGFFNWEARQFDTNPLWKDVDGQGNGICHYMSKDEYGWALHKKENHDCIFFKNKLCSLQRNFGPMAQPSICRTFPRIISKINDRIELALDPCCPYVPNMAKDWDLCDFVVSGDGTFEKDEKYLKREAALGIIADTEKPLAQCFSEISGLYDAGLEIPELKLSAERDLFVRKTTALLIWAFVIPYEGYPTIPNMMAYIISLMLQVLEVFEQEGTPGDWWEMSLSFTRTFIKSIKETDFDRDYECYYLDATDPQIAY